MKAKLTVFFLLYTLAGFSQSLEKLKSDTKKVHDAYLNMDFDAATQLAYPKIVESLGGNTAFSEKLDNDFQNDEFRKRIQIIEPVFQYSDIKTIEGKKFYRISYKNPIRYFFENKMDAATAQKKAAELKESAKAYEVVVEPKRNSINVKRNTILVAVSDESTNGEWRFFNFDDVQQRQVFDSVFGAGVKKELGL